MRIERAAIVCTGDEVVDGIIVDTDTPAIRKILLEHYPQCSIEAIPPVRDRREAIERAMRRMVSDGMDLGILVGGSGGGRRYDPALAVDCTHEAMRALLDQEATRDLMGYNGHLWARCVAGRKGQTLFFNVPGPQVEAEAAARAGICYLHQKEAVDFEALAETIASAVRTQYPEGRS
ncbi:MAG: molybdopterin-binding protein [Candidatus Sumerlaeota bacterium]